MVNRTIKREAFTSFFDQPNDFDRSVSGEVLSELSDLDIDFFKGKVKRRK